MTGSPNMTPVRLYKIIKYEFDFYPLFQFGS